MALFSDMPPPAVNVGFQGAKRTRIGPVYRTAYLPDATPNLSRLASVPNPTAKTLGVRWVREKIRDLEFLSRSRVFLECPQRELRRSPPMTKIELSRRMLIQKAAAASGAFTMLGTIANSAAAQAKSSPQVAGYQSEPNGGQRCGICQHFQPPSACKVVAGRISAQGWCRLYFSR